MKYSLNLLKNFIAVNDKIEDLAQNLILKTCEIEEIEKREIPESVLIGFVKKVEKHPDADKLKICEIDLGDKTEIIVTGAPNIKEGIFVPVAVVGTYLPAIDLKIEPRKLRGIESKGMICSKEELGLPDESEVKGIWNMNEDFVDLEQKDLGKKLKEKYPRLENVILDVDNKTLTHRPDLTGHFGLAVDLFAIYKFLEPGKIEFTKIPELLKTFDTTNILELLQNSKKSEIKIFNQTDGVRTYVLLEVKNIKVTKTDYFMQLLAEDLGLGTKNNWVDFSNIFMNLTGQPVHFFDADLIKGKIITRNAKNGEEFVDLFDNKHVLSENDLVIADEEKILALAGVVGAKGTGINSETKNIIIEIANFDPVSVRKTGTRLALRTDAELRYEKNINPVFTLYNLIFMLDFLKYFAKSLGNFEIGGVDFYISDFVKSLLAAKKSVTFDVLKASKFIFGEENSDFIENGEKILQYLGFEKKENKFFVPFRRSLSDINIEYDLYEEVARIYGYEKIQSKVFLDEVKYRDYSDFVKIQRYVEEFFVKEFKFIQLETYPWVSEKMINLFENNLEFLKIKNPVDENKPYLRDSLVYSLLDYVKKNSHFFDEIKIMDIGKVWRGLDCKDSNYTCDFLKEEKVAGIMFYQKNKVNWQQDGFLYLKAYVKKLFESLGIEFEIKKLDSVNFHPKKQLIFEKDGKVLAYIGEIHPLILLDLSFEKGENVYFAELNLDEIKKIADFDVILKKFYTLKTQIVYRDLSFVVEESEDFAIVLDAIKSVNEVQDVKIFDIYAGENLESGKKSISVTIKIVGDGNLESNQINQIMDKVIKVVEKNGGKLRE